MLRLTFEEIADGTLLRGGFKMPLDRMILVSGIGILTILASVAWMDGNFEGFAAFLAMCAILGVTLWVDRNFGIRYDERTLELIQRILAAHEDVNAVAAPSGGVFIRPRHEHFDDGTPAT